jgi:hypothetical protein
MQATQRKPGTGQQQWAIQGDRRKNNLLFRRQNVSQVPLVPTTLIVDRRKNKTLNSIPPTLAVCRLLLDTCNGA